MYVIFTKNIILWKFRNCEFDCQPGQMMVTGNDEKKEKDDRRRLADRQR